MKYNFAVYIQFGLCLGDPYVGVVKYVEAHPTHHENNLKNYHHDTRCNIRHKVTTP